MVDFQKVHDAREWAKDLARLGMLLAHKLPIPDPHSPLGHWDAESAKHQANFLQALRPKTMRLEVVGLRDETATTRTLVLRRTDGPSPVFRAGQYLSLNLNVEGIRTSRPYSLSSPPGKEVLEVTVKALPGEWVPNYLASQIHLRDTLVTSGPKGHFYYEPLIDGHDLVFLAGGSGITPFMSILSQLDSEGFRGRVTLIYGNRSAQDVIFAEQLAHLQQHVSWFTLHHLYSEASPGQPARFMDAATLRSLLKTTEGRTFFVCGPRSLYNTALAALADLSMDRPGGPNRKRAGPKVWPPLPNFGFVSKAGPCCRQRRVNPF